ncbi:MAG TPA: anaerobic ribonucleoside-triphosphate reductase [Methanothrix sp.]|nr:anaerobic ribonucleoside-triphosphate reductase [Methanothrix sp.]HOL44387.1 anaerobic ribonucleoside-triphosphate reductase [Methanothrix sp.]
MKVARSDGSISEWNQNAIIDQLEKDSELAVRLFAAECLSPTMVREIAGEVSRRVKQTGLKCVTGALVREVVNSVLLERGMIAVKNASTRVGVPLADAIDIDIGRGFEHNENANLQDNAETSHKKKADRLCKEQYLLMLPERLANAHRSGDVHIHDLEYFGTRPFCQDHDLRYFFYYGLMPDGRGNKASVAGPAKRPEVAILHAVKALGSAQTNFAGGQGFYNFLTFVAPYLEGLSYTDIKQLMQMFVYEMTQMMVARGGQLVFSSVQLTPGVPTIWRDKPVVYKGRIWNGEQAPLRTYGEFEREVRLAFKALMEVMLEGDYWGKPFSFPKPEISIEPDFMREDEDFNAAHPELPTYRELYLLAFRLAAKYGTPYFDNQLPEYRGAGEGISCYQCLSSGTRVAIQTPSGVIKTETFHSLFESAATLGKVTTDMLGGEYVDVNFDVFGVDVKTLKVDRRNVRGIVRRRYRGDVVSIQLDTGDRKLTATPDHPVFVHRNGRTVKVSAGDVREGDGMVVLQRTYSRATIMHVAGVKRYKYDGYVYDLVDVADVHNFAIGDGIVVGNCCAYQFSSTVQNDRDFEGKLHFRDGKHFSMGSWQVVTLNCPRAAYAAGHDDRKLIETLKKLMDVAAEVFVEKRKLMQMVMESDRMPFATQRPRDPVTGRHGSQAVDLDGLVYTIGVVGINEMVQYHTGKQLHESRDAWALAIRAITEMKIYAAELSRRYGMTIALARTPAETVAQRFAVLDLRHRKYSKLALAVVKGDVERALGMSGMDLPVYYTNGTHVNVAAQVTLQRRIELEHVFFPILDGGNIFHVFLGEGDPDPEALMRFGMDLAQRTQIGYFAFTKDMTVCMECYTIQAGLHETCSRCGSANVDQISRITGYLQAVSGWNEAKKQELIDRKRVDVV